MKSITQKLKYKTECSKIFLQVWCNKNSNKV